MSDYPMLISNKLHSFRNFSCTKLHKYHHLLNRTTNNYPIPLKTPLLWINKIKQNCHLYNQKGSKFVSPYLSMP